MTISKKRTRKHFQLDASKITRAQRVLKTKNETETIERALDLAIAEYERNRLTADANQRFVKSGIDIRGVYGTLDS